MGYKTTVTPGREALTVAGSSFDCRTEITKAISKEYGSTLQFKEWVHPDVPGGTLKHEFLGQLGTTKKGLTLVVLEWGLTPP